MAFNYGSLPLRKQIIDAIETTENQTRKSISLGQFEIFRDRLHPYVKKYLEDFYQKDTIKEMPIVASINLAQRIVKQEGAVYRNEPTRTFSGLTADQEVVIKQIYDDMKVNSYMKKANWYYKLQEQHHMQVMLSQGKLKLRCLLAHQLDVVPSPLDPEAADAYVVNGFDRSLLAPRLTDYEDGQDSVIADADDYKGNLERMALWSDEYNFIMDKSGNIVSGPDVANPIGMLPFVEITSPKDSEYWMRLGSAVTDFTIQFNGGVSDLGHIVRMQGFAQAWFKGAADMIPENLQIGPNFVLKLPIDKNNPVETDFGFANPSPDLAGSIQFIEMMLSSFLTSRGLDPKIVNGKGDTATYASGLERLLAMIQMFEPSKEDFDLFKEVEQKLFKIIVRYLNVYSGTDLLNYNVGQISEEARVDIKFGEPQSIMSEQEKLQNIQLKIDLGLMSQAEAIAYDRDIDIDAAKKVMTEIESERKEMFQPAVTNIQNKII